MNRLAVGSIVAAIAVTVAIVAAVPSSDATSHIPVNHVVHIDSPAGAVWEPPPTVG